MNVTYNIGFGTIWKCTAPLDYQTKIFDSVKNTLSLSFTHTHIYSLSASPSRLSFGSCCIRVNFYAFIEWHETIFCFTHRWHCTLEALSSVCSISILKLGAQSVKWFEVHKKIHKMCKAAHAHETRSTRATSTRVVTMLQKEVKKRRRKKSQPTKEMLRAPTPIDLIIQQKR